MIQPSTNGKNNLVLQGQKILNPKENLIPKPETSKQANAIPINRGRQREEIVAVQNNDTKVSQDHISVISNLQPPQEPQKQQSDSNPKDAQNPKVELQALKVLENGSTVISPLIAQIPIDHGKIDTSVVAMVNNYTDTPKKSKATSDQTTTTNATQGSAIQSGKQIDNSATQISSGTQKLIEPVTKQKSDVSTSDSDKKLAVISQQQPKTSNSNTLTKLVNNAIASNIPQKKIETSLAEHKLFHQQSYERQETPELHKIFLEIAQGMAELQDIYGHALDVLLPSILPEFQYEPTSKTEKTLQQFPQVYSKYLSTKIGIKHTPGAHNRSSSAMNGRSREKTIQLQTTSTKETRDISPYGHRVDNIVVQTNPDRSVLSINFQDDANPFPSSILTYKWLCDRLQLEMAIFKCLTGNIVRVKLAQTEGTLKYSDWTAIFANPLDKRKAGVYYRVKVRPSTSSDKIPSKKSGQNNRQLYTVYVHPPDDVLKEQSLSTFKDWEKNTLPLIRESSNLIEEIKPIYWVFNSVRYSYLLHADKTYLETKLLQTAIATYQEYQTLVGLVHIKLSEMGNYQNSLTYNSQHQLQLMSSYQIQYLQNLHPHAIPHLFWNQLLELYRKVTGTIKPVHVSPSTLFEIIGVEHTTNSFGHRHYYFVNRKTSKPLQTHPPYVLMGNNGTLSRYLMEAAIAHFNRAESIPLKTRTGSDWIAESVTFANGSTMEILPEMFVPIQQYDKLSMEDQQHQLHVSYFDQIWDDVITKSHIDEAKLVWTATIDPVKKLIQIFDLLTIKYTGAVHAKDKFNIGLVIPQVATSNIAEVTSRIHKFFELAKIPNSQLHLHLYSTKENFGTYLESLPTTHLRNGSTVENYLKRVKIGKDYATLLKYSQEV